MVFGSISCGAVSPLLTEPLNLYLTALEYDAVEDDTPYLFHPQGDTRRVVGSSQWSAVVKAAFQKHAGVACAPKLLRSSFITWLKDSVDGSSDANETLKAAAKAMRHKLDTQSSDKYDKKSHDRLAQAATQYVERFARTFGTVPIPDGWALVKGQPPSFAFTRTVEGEYVVRIEWFDALKIDTVYRWPIVPGRADGFAWKTPAAQAQAMTLTVDCDASAPTFEVTHLLSKATAPAAAHEPAHEPAHEVAPTEMMDEEDRPDVGDEWRAIDGEHAARRDGAHFVVSLPVHELLVAGAEVRFLHAARADMTEQIVRLSHDAPDGAAYQVPLQLDVDGDEDTLSGLQVRAPPPTARPQSMVQPSIPVADVHAALSARARSRHDCARNGDCFILSSMAGFELTNPLDVLAPRLLTIDAVSDARAAAVDLVAGDAAIGGIDACVVREQEMLEVDLLADWRTLGHWSPRDGSEGGSTGFMFGIAANLGRPVIVLERDGDVVLDPCYVYGARDAQGALHVTPARGTKPATVQFVKQMAYKDVLAALEARPRVYSVVEYDRNASHHSPFVYSPETESDAPAGAAAPAPADAPAPAAEEPPIPIPGAFIATPAVASRKAPTGTVRFVLIMPWHEAFHRGAKLSVYVPTMGSSVTVSLPAQLASGNVEVVLTLPNSVGSDPLPVGPLSIVASAKAMVAAKQPAAPKAPSPPKAPVAAAPKPPATPKPPAAPKAASRVKPAKTRAAKSPALPPPAEPPPPSRYGRKRTVKAIFGDGGEQDGPAKSFRSAPIAPKPFVALEDEMAIPAYCVPGARIMAVGWHGGSHKLFHAIVRGVRPRFPRLVVEFTADEHGAIHAVALPTPHVAHVHAGMVQEA